MNLNNNQFFQHLTCFFEVLDVKKVFILMSNLITTNTKIFIVRNVEIMLDRDVATFYKVSVKTLNKAKSRNLKLFEHDAFQLTKEEYSEILKSYNILTPPKGHRPTAYTARGAYKLSAFLGSAAATEMADVIFDYFMSFRNQQRGLVLSPNQASLLENKMSDFINKLEKSQTQNNFYAPVNLIQGSNNQIQVGLNEEFAIEMFKIMSDQQATSNQNIQKLISEILEKKQAGDQKGILDHLKTLADIGSSVTSISKGVPAIIEIIKKLF